MTRMRRTVLLLLLAFMSCAPAWGHSTKDRVKVPLDKDLPGIDDVAYFVESYVFESLYSDGTYATQYRFGVKEFLGVDVKDGVAQVRFLTLDKKGHKIFEDSMLLRRGDSGIWQYQPGKGGPPLEVYTYITKKAWLWKRYSQPAAFGFTALCAGALGIAWVRQKKCARDAETPLEEGQEPG